MKEEIINDINYRLDEDNLTAEVIKKSSGYEGHIIILKTVEFNERTYRVTSIGDRAFYDCKKLSSITFLDGVEIIGDNAFWGCESLISIAIPDSVKIIGDSAFAYCHRLTTITFQGAAPWIKGIALGDDWHFGSPAKIVIAPTA